MSIRDYAPVVLAFVVIVVASLYEGIVLKDRWGDPDVSAVEFGKRFENVPLNIGEWKGEDMPVDEVVRETAGAVNYVQRLYTHIPTGRQVTLWLIVGHSRDIIRHKPTTCYPSSGFTQQGSTLKHNVDLENGKTASFFTGRFEKEDPLTRQMDRVFWSWNHPDRNTWEAPDNPRHHYGMSRALYKVYFTSKVGSEEDTVERNAAAEFAQVMLPAIDAALFPETPPATGDAAPPSEESTDG